jgi:PmbA protein
MSEKAFNFTEDQFRSIAVETLSLAKKLGASAVEVDINENIGSTVTVRKGDVETIEYNQDKGFGITTYVGQSKGHASSSDVSPESLKRTVEAAVSIAKLTAEDDFAGLADPSLLATSFKDLDLFHPWDISVNDSIDLGKACESVALSNPSVTNSEGATVSSQKGHFIYANSNGFMHGYPSSRNYISCSVTAGEKSEMQRDGWWTSARDARDMEDATSVGERAASRAVRKVGARKIGTKKVPVIFDSTISSGIIGHFVSAISGGALYRKQTFLLDSLGQNVFPNFISIREEPHIRKGFSSSCYDSEGVATRPRVIVDRGLLQGYVLSSYSARKLGMVTTGNAGGVHNLVVDSAGSKPFEELLKDMGTGLWVTDLLGHGINMVTGDYSRGASGFWVENGIVQYPVQEITIAGNLKEMFSGITAVGNDILERSTTKVGSILFERMTVAGD